MIAYERRMISLVFVLLLSFLPNIATGRPIVKLGIDVLGEQHPELVRGHKITLLVSSTARDAQLRHTIDRLGKATKIQIIYTGDPYFRETIPSASGTTRLDALTNAEVREIQDPLQHLTPNDLGDSELIVVDVQDIGIRFFRYITILAQFLDLAAKSSCPILVLDRPNPLGAALIAGPVLETAFRSRFGVYPIPLVYGMTIGETALYFNRIFHLGADLTVVGMEGYDRRLSFRLSGHHWHMPNPYLPEPETPFYYAITGFLGEMGIFSTGVGTTRPFHYVLAPWVDGELLATKLAYHKMPGVRFLPTEQKPMYGLFQRKKVPGIEIVIVDPLTCDPVLVGIAILRSLWELYPNKVPLQNPALAQALDTLLGTSSIRTGILAGKPLFEIQSQFYPGLKQFKLKRRDILIYPE